MKRSLIAFTAWALFAGCAQTGQPPQVRLIETYWKAVELEGRPLDVKPGTREPHLILRSENKSVGGYSGCNTFRGGYVLDGASLRFTRMASTMMACLPAGSDTERNFLSALSATAAHDIRGETLQLLDSDGKVRARFTSRQPR